MRPYQEQQQEIARSKKTSMVGSIEVTSFDLPESVQKQIKQCLGEKMNKQALSELCLFLLCATLMISAGFIIGACIMEGQTNRLKAEAVQKGYAEWFGDEGEMPNQWRWK